MKYLDSNGVERYKADPVIEKLYENGFIDLNELRKKYYEGKFTLKEMKKIYRGM